MLLTQLSTVDSVTGKLPGEVGGWLGKLIGCGASGGLFGGGAACTEAAGTNENMKTIISSTSVPPQIAEVLCFMLIQTFSPEKQIVSFSLEPQSTLTLNPLVGKPFTCRSWLMK